MASSDREYVTVTVSPAPEPTDTPTPKPTATPTPIRTPTPTPTEEPAGPPSITVSNVTQTAARVTVTFPDQSAYYMLRLFSGDRVVSNTVVSGQSTAPTQPTSASMVHNLAGMTAGQTYSVRVFTGADKDAAMNAYSDDVMAASGSITTQAAPTGPVPVPTPEPRPAPPVSPPSPRFTARIDIPVPDYGWEVLAKESVTLTVTPKSSSTIMAEWEFKLDLGNTGLRFATGPLCSHAAAVGDWLWPDEIDGGGRATISLVRCGLGEAGNTSLKVHYRARGSTSATTIGVSGDSVDQARHQEDRHVSYDYSLASLSGQKPSYVPAVYDYLTVTEEAMTIAVGRWNDAAGRRVFERAARGADAQMTVKGFWHGDDACENARSMGCLVRGRNTHMGDLTFWFRYPPKGQYEGEATMWTTDRRHVIRNPERYTYMPFVAMHEAGHGVGLGHIANTGYIMSTEYSVHVSDVTDVDKAGLKAVLESHSH